MSLPDNQASPGWYESPSSDAFEQYWDGESWTEDTRPVSGKGKYLGTMFFRSPITSDWAFGVYAVVLGVSLISMIAQDAELISASRLLLLVPMVAITGIWIYILFLVFLIPRRIIDKKRGLTKPPVYFVTNSEKSRNKTTFFAVGIGVVIIVVAIQVFSSTNKGSLAAFSDEWFAEEQRISAIQGEWNNATLPVMQVIRGISDGTISENEALQQISISNPKVTAVLEKLRIECEGIPRQDTTGEGEAAAVAKSWLMLTEACDVIPQQWVETIAIYAAQVDNSSTQADIDFHVKQLQALGDRRKVAIINAIEALTPYATAAQKEALDRMSELLKS